MMYCTSMYAVHEYQTCKTGVIIESNFGGLRCFSLSLYSFSSPTFCPTFFKEALPLRAGVSRVLKVLLPVGPSEARSLNILSAFYCALLCLIDELKQSLFNKSTT